MEVPFNLAGPLGKKLWIFIRIACRDSGYQSNLHDHGPASVNNPFYGCPIDWHDWILIKNWTAGNVFNFLWFFFELIKINSKINTRYKYSLLKTHSFTQQYECFSKNPRIEQGFRFTSNRAEMEPKYMQVQRRSPEHSVRLIALRGDVAGRQFSSRWFRLFKDFWIVFFLKTFW